MRFKKKIKPPKTTLEKFGGDGKGRKDRPQKVNRYVYLSYFLRNVSLYAGTGMPRGGVVRTIETPEGYPRGHAISSPMLSGSTAAPSPCLLCTAPGPFYQSYLAPLRVVFLPQWPPRSGVPPWLHR